MVSAHIIAPTFHHAHSTRVVGFWRFHQSSTAHIRNEIRWPTKRLLVWLQADFELESLIHNIRSSVIHKKADGDGYIAECSCIDHSSITAEQHRLVGIADGEQRRAQGLPDCKDKRGGHPDCSPNPNPLNYPK